MSVENWNIYLRIIGPLESKSIQRSWFISIDLKKYVLISKELLIERYIKRMAVSTSDLASDLQIPKGTLGAREDQLTRVTPNCAVSVLTPAGIASATAEIGAPMANQLVFEAESRFDNRCMHGSYVERFHLKITVANMRSADWKSRGNAESSRLRPPFSPERTISIFARTQCFCETFIQMITILS